MERSAHRLCNNPAVIYDLYNEPHDVSWDVWQNGGRITDRPNGRKAGPARAYACVGMQTLLDTVRATGAKNVVVAGGLDWAYDFSGILMAGSFPTRMATGSFTLIIATTTSMTA